MFRIYHKLYILLSPDDRRKAVLLCFLLMVNSIAEVAGVASILPFIAVLSKPELIDTNQYLSFAYHSLGFTSHKSFMIFLGFFFLGILILGLAVNAVVLWAQLRYSMMRSFTWSLQLFEDYLQKPYEWFLNHHSSQMANSIIGEVRQVISGALIPALQTVTGFFTTILLLVLLIIADPLLALASGGLLGGLYAVISYVLARHVKKFGIEQRDSQKERHRVVQETFAGIKDIKVSGMEKLRAEKFSEPAYSWASCAIKAGLAGQLPHFMTQGIMFGGMLLVILYLISFYGSLQEALPVAALFAFATNRLMPNIQRIYTNVSSMHQHEAVLDSIIQDLHLHESSKLAKQKPADALGLSKALVLDRLSYSYPGTSEKALKNISINIPANSTIGLVGSSGSGKTTLVDIVMCLLPPSSGNIIVDGQEIKDDLQRAWQKSIGYVPQHIFLLDDSVTANIAFGIPAGKIDQQRVEAAARLANLHDFVVDSLPHSYETTVGDRGVRLSGGQRQRFGIARALYHDPDVLIFDEATSALDSITEQAVMEAINNLGNFKTIILIAHRLSTVQKCDCIYVLNKGRVSAAGTYQELLTNSSEFQELATGGQSSKQ